MTQSEHLPCLLMRFFFSLQGDLCKKVGWSNGVSAPTLKTLGVPSAPTECPKMEIVPLPVFPQNTTFLFIFNNGGISTRDGSMTG